MVKHDDIGNRMKENYENVSKLTLTHRMPVIIRIDGRAFHTFTKGLRKPYDKCMSYAMKMTMLYLAQNIQNCVFGYTQSDEISLLLIDYQTLTTSAWFGNQVQKIVSISASMATSVFPKFFREQALKMYDDGSGYKDLLLQKSNEIIQFDARVFNIPREEVNNYFYWRQIDAVKNSIQSLGHALFTTKELKGKSNNEVQDMLIEKYDINWNDVATDFKRGSACYRGIEIDESDCELHWIVDEYIPRFNVKPKYIEKWLNEDIYEKIASKSISIREEFEELPCPEPEEVYTTMALIEEAVRNRRK